MMDFSGDAALLYPTTNDTTQQTAFRATPSPTLEALEPPDMAQMLEKAQKAGGASDVGVANT